MSAPCCSLVGRRWQFMMGELGHVKAKGMEPGGHSPDILDCWLA